MLAVMRSDDPRLAGLLGDSHARFARLVHEAEERARPYYQRLLGKAYGIEEVIDLVFREVESDGESAIARWVRLFDGADLPPGGIRVPPAACKAAWEACDASLRQAIETAISQVAAYQRRLLPRGFGEDLTETLGCRWLPLRRVGAYVPGGPKGSLPLFSSVVMNLVPAVVAGVPETILVTPPRPDGSVAPELLAAAHAVGVGEVWRVGGIPAIAALACGCPALPKADKIVGPGNIFVTLAKRRAYGRVDIDMLAGPSEVLVIADATADARFVAADLLSQAEHDVLAMSVLLALDEATATRVRDELVRQLALLPEERRKVADESLRRFGALVVCANRDEAIALSERIAPEHLELMVAKPRDWLPAIRNAGAVFVGPWSPEPIGDYVAGPSHTLPTGGTARMWSGIGADTFLRRSSLINLDEASFRRLAGAGMRLARGEGLEAHARAIEVRLG